MRSILVLSMILLAGCSSPGHGDGGPLLRAQRENARVEARRTEALAGAREWQAERARRERFHADAMAAAALNAPVLAKGMTVAQAGAVFSGRQLSAERMAVNVPEVALAAELGQGTRFVEVRRWTFVNAAVGSVHELEVLLVVQRGAVVAWVGPERGGANLSTDMLAHRDR